MKIGLTGSSGFVGKFLKNYFNDKLILDIPRNGFFDYNSIDIVIHLAGKSPFFENQFYKDEFYSVNTNLTKSIFDQFLKSTSKTFIYFSSVKAVTESFDSVLTEDIIPRPTTHYGLSKFFAEQYILSHVLPL